MKIHLLSTLGSILIAVTSIQAQDMSLLQQLSAEDQNAIEAIALYPAQEREAILLASQHPEVLIRMENIRTTTEAKFKETIKDLSEAEQKRFYNLFRYPDLIDSIGDKEHGRSTREMNELLQSYPEEIRSDALYANQYYFRLIRDLHRLHNGAENAFHNVLSVYPANIREAFRQLDQLPAVTSLMTDNIKMTILLGDLYEKQPQQILHVLDSLNIAVAEQQAKEIEDWKQQLSDNPEAMKEFETAAREFTGNASYDDVYDGPQPERYPERVVIHEVWRPYSYWFGWPSWYVDECWYPYPWWYHSGFYYGPGHVIVIIGLPSSVFFNWHFHHAHHFYYYPHFTDHIFRHYYGPRHIGSHVQPVFKRWHEDHRSELPSHWFDEDKNRVDRIREYGKFKMDYEKKVGVRTEKSPTEREFLEKYADRYPTLKPVLIENPEPPENRNKTDQRYSPGPEPRTRQQEPGKEVTPEEKIDRARENHEKVWDNQRKPPRDYAPQTNPSKRDKQNPPRTEPTKPKQQQQQPAPRTDPGKKDRDQPHPSDPGTKKPRGN